MQKSLPSIIIIAIISSVFGLAISLYYPDSELEHLLKINVFGFLLLLEIVIFAPIIWMIYRNNKRKRP
jgi:heme/copper-type cytochrome/quinol oxidase subunit 4